MLDTVDLPSFKGLKCNALRGSDPTVPKERVLFKRAPDEDNTRDLTVGEASLDTKGLDIELADLDLVIEVDGVALHDLTAVLSKVKRLFLLVPGMLSLREPLERDVCCLLCLKDDRLNFLCL